MNGLLDRILDWLEYDRGWEKVMVVSLSALILSALVTGFLFLIAFVILSVKLFGG